MSAEQNLAARPWTPVEEARLRELWPTHAVAELADLFGRSPNGIYQRASKLGLSVYGRWRQLREAHGEIDANGHAESAPAIVATSVAREAPGWDEPGGRDPLPPAIVADEAPVAIVRPDVIAGPPLVLGESTLTAHDIADVSAVLAPAAPDALDLALATVARLARAGSGQVAELRAERDALRAVTEQQAGLIAAYQAALGGRGTQPDELRRVERDLDLAGGECNRLDAELAELQHSHRALLDQHHELQADHDLLLTQLATTPAVTVPSDRDSHYEAELRRCWLVIAWLRKAIGPREAMRLLDCAYLGKLEQVADQLAEVGRLTAEGRAVAP